jgi:hypothetical protein
MLADYYDIAKREQFNQLFGQLYIGQNPTPFHNSHLILLFDFSSIVTDGSRQEAISGLNRVLKGVSDIIL